MKKPQIPVALEGYPFIFFSVFASLVLAILGFLYATLACVILTGFILWFFRDPERITPQEPGGFISPADGKVIVAERVADERFLNREVTKISIFMNVFNVHVNRFPYTGEIQKVFLQPGRFYSADTRKGALYNEYCGMTVKTGDNLEYCVVQVAGLIARRIICWAEPGDTLKTGQRYGLIRFGSRVDLYLPADFQLSVCKDDKVRAGETILGNVRSATS